MKIVVLIASLTITVPLFSLPFSLLSIITKPIGYQGETWFHPAVTRSVIDGLRKINVPYNVNPSSVAALGDVVWVLTNEQALLQCIALKNNKIIKILLAGPNFVILPHESNRLLTHPSIDGLLLPSSAIKQVYIDDEPWGDRDGDDYFGDYSEYPAEYDRTKRGLWPAVQDFLQRHPEWSLYERHFNNHGFTILRRVGA